MRVAVVGHVEWVEFARVDSLPRPGQIVETPDWWEEAAGGGAVAAVALARLAGEATLYTALGDDDLGGRARHRLGGLGVRVLAARRPERQRRAFTFVDAAGERTITVLGDRLVPRSDDDLPWGELADFDSVYFTGGDSGALRAARTARTLVATARAGAVLGTGVGLDALVGSGRDPRERLSPGTLAAPPRLTVETLGGEGGRYRLADGSTGTYPAAPLPGPRADAYGAGDSFAAGLTYGLGGGWPLERTLDLAARCGAACLTRRGPYPASGLDS